MVYDVKRAFQSVALALMLALLASPAAALAMCPGMERSEHCPQEQPAMHCPQCPEDSSAAFQQQPVPMDETCCVLAPARPAPRTEVQGPTFAPLSMPLVRMLAAHTPALPTPPPRMREAVFLLPAESPQAVLCTFLI